MITRKEEDRMKALEYAGITSLPRALTDKTRRIWVDAIIEVQKADTSTSYAYGYNRINSTPRYEKVWGSCSSIRRILNIYPVHYLEKDYIIEFKSMEDMRNIVANQYCKTVESLAKYSDDEIKALAYNYAIECQIIMQKQEGLDKYQLKEMIKNEKIFKEITGGSR